jgi:hypothetical protein
MPLRCERDGREQVAVEQFMDEWSNSGHDRRLLDVTQMLLAVLDDTGYRCAFADSRDQLDGLLSLVRPTVVVTPNYDTLTEEVIQRQGLRIALSDHPGPHAPSVSTKAISYQRATGTSCPSSSSTGRSTGHPPAPCRRRRQGSRRAHGRPALGGATLWSPRRLWRPTCRPTGRRLCGRLTARCCERRWSSAVRIGRVPARQPATRRGPSRRCLERHRAASTGKVLAIGIRQVAEEDDPFVSRLLRSRKNIRQPTRGGVRTSAGRASNWSARRWPNSCSDSRVTWPPAAVVLNRRSP